MTFNTDRQFISIVYIQYCMTSLSPQAKRLMYISCMEVHGNLPDFQKQQKTH